MSLGFGSGRSRAGVGGVWIRDGGEALRVVSKAANAIERGPLGAALRCAAGRGVMSGTFEGEW